ncbi:MAG: hypothetical protein FD180_89 [Planctomycetota bacterium]|nr:MAG: hypothetical protein FD180_89 [Planctomycetota bacterium]
MTATTNRNWPFQAPDSASELLKIIKEFPSFREFRCTCGSSSRSSPLDIYATCPNCLMKFKQRSFGGGPEVEDFFDAVLEWAGRADAREFARRRQRDIQNDPDFED